jgi:hypothetical protein
VHVLFQLQTAVHVLSLPGPRAPVAQYCRRGSENTCPRASLLKVVLALPAANRCARALPLSLARSLSPSISGALEHPPRCYTRDLQLEESKYGNPSSGEYAAIFGTCSWKRQDGNSSGCEDAAISLPRTTAAVLPHVHVFASHLSYSVLPPRHTHTHSHTHTFVTHFSGYIFLFFMLYFPSLYLRTKGMGIPPQR